MHWTGRSDLMVFDDEPKMEPHHLYDDYIREIGIDQEDFYTDDDEPEEDEDSYYD